MRFSNIFTAATLTTAHVTLAGGVTQSVVDGRQTCTVLANGNQTDDVPNILLAAQECGSGGTIVFPEDQNYWIATRLNPVFNDVIVEWHGQWTVRIPQGKIDRVEILTQCSSPQTLRTGVIIPIPLPSRTIMQALLSPATTSTLTVMGLVE